MCKYEHDTFVYTLGLYMLSVIFVVELSPNVCVYSQQGDAGQQLLRKLVWVLALLYAFRMSLVVDK